MKLIQLSEHSEPKPYILKANYNLETKATYFNSKEKLIESPQTQVLSYCVANGYEDCQKSLQICATGLKRIARHTSNLL